MRVMDRLNTCKSEFDLKLVLNGMRLDTYIFMETSDYPEWIDLGQLKLNGVTYGVSNILQAYMLEYEVLFDEAKNPKNQGPLPERTHAGYSHLARCNDAITLRLMVEEGKIQAAKWEGEGCTMCLSSASLMTQEIIGKDIDDVKADYGLFRMMLEGGVTPASLPERLLIFQPVRANILKVQCVMVPWEALRKALK